LLLAIGDELQKTPQNCPWEDLPSGYPKPPVGPSREEAVCRVHNIVVSNTLQRGNMCIVCFCLCLYVYVQFGQLGSFTLSMLEFDVPFGQIQSFVETMCDAHELTEDQRFLLRKNLEEILITLR
jgi:hypothetical protein